MKIIETNVQYNELGLYDYQSRVIEIPSWEEYCNLFIYYDGNPVGLDYECVFPKMVSYVLPKDAQIVDLIIEDFRLTCKMELSDGLLCYKLVWIAEF